MKAFVTGGTGFLGQHLVEELIHRKYNVTCLVRERSALHKRAVHNRYKKLGINLVYGDIGDLKSLMDSLEGDYDLIFHLVGIVPSKEDGDFYKINVEGTRNLVRAIVEKNVGINRLIHLSSISAIGAVKSITPITEETEPNPKTPYEISKYKSEVVIRNFYEQHKIPSTIIRPPMAYGFGDHFELVPLANLVARGIAPIFVSKNAPINLVYVKNLIEGIMLAAEKGTMPYDVFIISDSRPYTMGELFKYLADAERSMPFHMKIPASIVKLFSKKHEYLRLILNNVHVSIKKATETLGYRPVNDLEHGIRESIRYYALVGKLKHRKYPLSQYDALQIAFEEGEGLGSAYEYYMKTKMLLHLLERTSKIHKTVLIALPRAHGSLTSIKHTLHELGEQNEVVELTAPKFQLSLSKHYEVAVVVGDIIENVEHLLNSLKGFTDTVVVFTNNQKNMFHVGVWKGTDLKQLVKAKPLEYGYLDSPPFLSGIKVYSNGINEITLKFKMAMSALTLWTLIEEKMPTPLKKKISHMAYAVYKAKN